MNNIAIVICIYAARVYFIQNSSGLTLYQLGRLL